METLPQREQASLSAKQNANVQLLTFKLDEQEYALRVENVVQVVRMVAVTRAPKAPDYVDGIVNLRGRVIPVINIRNRCGLPSKTNDLNTQLLIAQARGKTIAFTVDMVSEVLNLAEANLEPPNEIGAEMQYISDIALVGDRLVLVVDPGALLNDGEMELSTVNGAGNLERVL